MTTATTETISQILASIESAGAREALNLARSSGVKTTGYCCPYVPVELILAHRMLPVRLDPADAPAGSCCACACGPGPAATSPSGLAGTLDGLVVTTNVDSPGQPEQLQSVPGLPVMTLQLPPFQDRYRTSPGPERDFRAGLKSLERSLGSLGGARPGYLDMISCLLAEKRLRQCLKALYEATLSDSTPVTWRQAERLSRAGAGLDRAGYRAGLETLLGRLDEAPRPPADGRSRLMLYGPPLGPASDQVLDLLERSGGVVVTDYICTASARLRKRVPVWGTFERPFDSLAEHYLFNAPCPFMGDYAARLERMLRLSRWYRVHGLVGLNPGSNPVFRADFERLSEDFYSRLFIPSLYIEDSLPLEDPRGLEERVGGFIDIIGGRV